MMVIFERVSRIQQPEVTRCLTSRDKRARDAREKRDSRGNRKLRNSEHVALILPRSSRGWRMISCNRPRTTRAAYIEIICNSRR